jgi:hypothetical protein
MPSQRFFFYPIEADHFGTNRIHQPLAPTISDSRDYGGHFILAAQLNNMRHFRQLAIY